jgi:hypothetical protein
MSALTKRTRMVAIEFGIWRSGRKGGSPGSITLGRIVARAYQNPVAGLYAVIFHQRMRKAVRPVRQLLVGALATVAAPRFRDRRARSGGGGTAEDFAA